VERVVLQGELLVERGRFCSPFSEPGFEHRDDATLQGRAACLAPFSEASHMCADTEIHIAMSKGAQLGVPQAGLHGHEQ
jgi:hypothetical protein